MSKFIIILFCISIYPITLRFSPVMSYAAIYGIPFCYLLCHFRQFVKITKKQLMVTVMLFLLLLLSIFYPALHGTGDYSYVKVITFIFRKSVIYLFLVCILLKYYKEKIRVEIFYYYFALANAIYVVGTLCFVFVPGLHQLWFKIFSENVENTNVLLQSFGYTFRIGWQGFSGFRMTLHCTLSCLFLLYMYYSRDSKIRIKKHVFFISYALCFMGNMFYGRSGLAVTVLLTIVAIVAWNRGQLKKIFRFVIAGAFFIMAIYIFRDAPLISDWYEWMSRPFINLLKSGSFQNASFSSLSDMYFLPGGKTILSNV